MNNNAVVIMLAW